MKLRESEARSRLACNDHGILGTLHPERGVDLVPCVYAVVDDDLGVPIDRVKPKLSGSLQRERNLAQDPRAILLTEHWDHDEWSRLWWVRAELRWHPAAPDQRTAALAAQLAVRFTQYRDRPFERVLLMQIVGVTGWAAAG